MTRPKSALRIWTPLLAAIILILGMVLGFHLRDTLRHKRDIVSVLQRNDRLEEIIDLINEKYVDTLNSNSLYSNAVVGILSHLDPHTVYIPADQLQAINEDMEGSFYGIGVEFTIIKDTIQVTAVTEQGPAERAGVQVGDQMIKVNDTIVAGNGITSEAIIALLKGKQNTPVRITMYNYMARTTRVVTIQRGAIPLYSVDAAIMLDSMTGFIKINRFSATTYEEFTKALKDLKGKGMRQLVLDLRQNPGGYLDAATKIADDFLSGEKLLTYTEGRRSPRTDYKAGEQNSFERGNLAILVDESAASASEILAGAVQDWDRGVIIGRSTFGKGLVQEQYELEDGAALRLTIAKYYTPSGRSIQRSFAKGKGQYAQAYEERFESGELTGADTLAPTDTTRYYTDGGRVVYGGGGIRPDVYVPYDTTRLKSSLLTLIYSEGVKNAVLGYYIRNRKQLTRYQSIGSYTQQFDINILYNHYIQSLESGARSNVAKLLSAPASLTYFKLHMKAQLARMLFRSNGYYAVLSKEDNAVQKALQVLNGPQYLELISR